MNAELLAAYEAQKAAGASPEILAPLAKALGLEKQQDETASGSSGAQMTLKEFEAHVRSEVLAAQLEPAETGAARLTHLATQAEAVTKSVIEAMNADSFTTEKTFAVTPFVPEVTDLDLGATRVLKALAENDVTDYGVQRGILKSLGLDEAKATGPQALEWGDWPDDLATGDETKSNVDWAAI